MNGPRRAAWLIGLGLAATATAPLAQPGASTQETGPDSSPAAQRSADPADPIPPVLPELTVTAETPADHRGEPHLPPLPEAPVVVAVDDVLSDAIAMRLSDPQAALLRRLGRKEREGVAAFYARAGFRALWLEHGAWTAAARQLIRRLEAADEDGLEASDYAVPDLSGAAGPQALAEAELMLSAAAILYGRDARGARIAPSRLSGLVTPTLLLPEADAILSHLSDAADPSAVLAAYNPPHAGYRALKARLAEVRASRTGATVSVPGGPALKVGMHDARLPLLRRRLGLDAAGDAALYDERVAAAVAAFQRQQGLPATGVLTSQTVASLSSASSAQLESDLVANMERWRWLPAELGERHIAVNVPEYRLRIVSAGDVVHQARVIVGRPETPTPIFSDVMEHLVVNPSWTIPPSIMKKEILPALMEDPYYAERKGYQVIRKGGRITVRQPPGERNALGLIKFMFPNEHAVYLHDTPHRKLFSAERRAFSHGCVRVDQPFGLAEQVLGRDHWPEERLRKLVGRGERHIRLAAPLPVHLTYFTLAVDEQGRLQRFDDLYGLHGRVRAALGFDTPTAALGRSALR